MIFRGILSSSYVFLGKGFGGNRSLDNKERFPPKTKEANAVDRFTEIDRETWPRKALFELYTKAWMEMTYSATVKLRAERLVKRQKARGQKLTPALIYLFTREISRDRAFTTAIRDGTLGYWDRLQPVYPVLNDDGTFTFHTARVEGDFPVFYDAYLREQAENAGKRGAYASNDMPVNGYTISVMPFLAFDSFSFSLKNIKHYFAPIISIGKYDDNFLLPVAATVNHAVCDGYHLSELFRRLQDAFDHPDAWLD